MKSVQVAALAALLSANVQAQPMAGHNHAKNLHARLHHAKREVVWETVMEIETVTVFKTVYDDGTTPTSEAQVAAYTHTHKHTSSAVVVTSSAAPASSASSAAETSNTTPAAATTTAVAPAPSTTELSTSSSAASVSSASSSEAPAPTSEAPAPVATTSAYVAPVPATTTAAAYTATTDSTTAAAPTATVAPSTGTSYEGDMTYYDVGLGACGWTNTDSEDVVAVSHLLWSLPAYYDANPNNNKLCGKYVTMTGKDGNSYQAKIVDRCTGCAEGDLDLTEQQFNIVTSNGDGRVGQMKWTLG